MSGRDDQDEGFLTRWSRRKREIARDEEAAPAPPVAAPASLPADVVAPEPEAEMVEPPSLDLVDKDFDVAHWLKQNVPESWKLAALRRAWESDPAIRDFENPARDYALDWNTPGGAPGYGPLTESDDVEAMVRGIFGDAPEKAAETASLTDESDSVSHQLSSHDESASEHAAVRRGQDGPVLEGPLPAGTEDAEPTEAAEKSVVAASIRPAALQNAADPEPPAPRQRRRGGGALPQ